MAMPADDTRLGLDAGGAAEKLSQPTSGGDLTAVGNEEHREGRCTFLTRYLRSATSYHRQWVVAGITSQHFADTSSYSCEKQNFKKSRKVFCQETLCSKSFNRLFLTDEQEDKIQLKVLEMQSSGPAARRKTQARPGFLQSPN